jgi:hypothetical protein
MTTLFERRVKEKQESRDKDERDLASGKKTQEQLREENGLFFGRKCKIRFDK